MRYYKEPEALVAAPDCLSPFGTDDQHPGNTRHQPPAERFRSQAQADYGSGGGNRPMALLDEGRGAARAAPRLHATCNGMGMGGGDKGGSTATAIVASLS